MSRMKSIMEAQNSLINTNEAEIKDVLFEIGAYQRFQEAKKLVSDEKEAGSYIERFADMIIIVIFRTKPPDRMVCGLFDDPRILEISNDELLPFCEEFFNRIGFHEPTKKATYNVKACNPLDN
jgi:hypothetical protein